MEPLRNLNFSAENSSSLDGNSNSICYNMDPRYLKTSDFNEWYIANCLVNALLAIAATLGNLFILKAIWRTSTLHTPSYIILFCLALSDLGVGLLAQPMVVIYTVAKIRGFVSMACVTGIVVALVATYLCGISLLSVTVVSIDRYLALYLHLRYTQLVTNKRVVALLVYTWLLAAFVLVTWLWYPLLVYCIGVAIGLGCIIISTFCFCRIYLVLRHHHRQICSQPLPSTSTETSVGTLNSKRYRHSVLGMLMVYIVLLLCYMPYLCMSCVIVIQGTTITNRLLFELMRTVVFANSAFNPFIYCWRLRDIREAVIQRLPCACLVGYSTESSSREITRSA